MSDVFDELLQEIHDKQAALNDTNTKAVAAGMSDVAIQCVAIDATLVLAKAVHLAGVTLDNIERGGQR